MATQPSDVICSPGPGEQYLSAKCLQRAMTAQATALAAAWACFLWIVRVMCLFWNAFQEKS
eukprot:1875672-Prymnesium_polylepis.1